ncbi:MAG: hypothetical protein WD533_03595, partial [Dehalococcoidia bacterium]
MFQRRPQPGQIPAQSPSGECRHLYLTGEAVCVHCGMKFELAWFAEKPDLTRPVIRNAAFAVVSGLGLGATIALSLSLVMYVFLAATVLFGIRMLLGTMEFFGKHGFVPGKLGPLIKAPIYNILLPKPYITSVTWVRFPIDKAAYQQFQEGETVLIEHLRWSRLPVAIYRGH